MDELVIHGGTPLMGEVTVSGSKNAVVAIIPAAVLVDGVCRIENVPNISDVAVITELLTRLGAVCTRLDDGSLEIDSRKVNKYNPPHELVKKMRASYYLIGALLGRFNNAQVCMPGGCNFGHRPIDLHIKGFEALGATVDEVGEVITAYTDELKGGSIYLDFASVGATINIMLAAVRAKGVTTIENAAKEPHIVDVANFLNAMGANVKGAGTDTIKIIGVDRLGGGTYSIIPDQIEAGTFMIAAAATRGDVLVKNVIPRHMETLTAKLTEMGVTVEEFDDSIRVYAPTRPTRARVKTMPYPGFPTDLQALMVALMALADGISSMTETVYDNRFQYVDELRRMGADINVDGRTAMIRGVPKLTGANVTSMDLRAGAAVLVAGLAAEGKTVINTMAHIDRGYDNIIEKMTALGASLERVSIAEKV